jgi:hypothetical protein
MDDQAKEKFLSHFCRYLVGIGWVDYGADEQGRLLGVPRAISVSAFVMSFDDKWVLVTAGHILEDLDTLLRSGRRMTTSVLLDAWSLGAQSTPPIPFMLEHVTKLYRYAPHGGLDFGLIGVSPMYRKLLEANGVAPFAAGDWESHRDAEFDVYWMLGIPTEKCDVLTTPTSQGTRVRSRVNPVMIPVERLTAAPEALAGKTFPCFHGRVAPEVGITDIDGTSGGPIIGFRLEEGQPIKYSVVAIQSGWVRRSRITWGCLISVFLFYLKTAMEHLPCAPGEGS